MATPIPARLPLIAAGWAIKWTLPTLRLALPINAELPLLDTAVATTKLGPQMAEYIYENYSYRGYTDVAYIADRLEARTECRGI